MKEVSKGPTPDPFATAKESLISFVGGEWVPSEDNFAAIKRKLREAQAARQRIKAFGSSNRKATVDGLVHEVYAHRTAEVRIIQALFINFIEIRVALTHDAQRMKARKEAETIFSKYVDAAKKTIPATGIPERDITTSFIAATNALQKDMRPLMRTERIVRRLRARPKK